jgi:hypothetical protein
MSDELSKLNLKGDFDEATGVSDATRWTLEMPGDLEVFVTMSPASAATERFQARLLWGKYPDEPPSLKFRDPVTGRLDLPQAWPIVRGFRPQTLDACVNWCLEQMTNPYFTQIETWRIPRAAIRDALAEMAIDGSRGNEGIVLFLGSDHGATAQVTHLVKLRGLGVERYPDQININAALINEVTDAAIERNVRLIGQVHSHGPAYGVDLSPTDRIYGIRAPFYLSLVAPDYGMSAVPIQYWGVHVFMEAQGYVRLSTVDLNRRVKITPGERIRVLTVGEPDGI